MTGMDVTPQYWHLVTSNPHTARIKDGSQRHETILSGSALQTDCASSHSSAAVSYMVSLFWTSCGAARIYYRDAAVY